VAAHSQTPLSSSTKAQKHDQRTDEDVPDAYRLWLKGSSNRRQDADRPAPRGQKSGIKEAEVVLKDIDAIEFVYFTEKDVVRHKLVQMIVKAYETHSNSEASE
jgi:hypothetical protein